MSHFPSPIADIEKQMKGYYLYHSLTGNDDIVSFIDIVLKNNGAMVSTIEKMRIGVPVRGMSSIRDMDSGGASYFFTRIQETPTAGKPPRTGLYFKKRMLRRMDAISYNHDAYGEVKDKYASDHRGSTPDEWKEFACADNNETIFKYSVTLLDNIDVIVVRDKQKKQQMLDVFRKYKIMKLPDGRNVEDIVLTRYV